MRFHFNSAFPLLALLLSTASPAAADFLVTWYAPDFLLKVEASEVPYCVGDMVGNGGIVTVGRFESTTEVRDALTGELLKQFAPNEVFGIAYAMVDLDNDGSMECVVADSSATWVIDWILVSP